MHLNLSRGVVVIHRTAREEIRIEDVDRLSKLTEIAIDRLERMALFSRGHVVALCGPLASGGFGSYEENKAFLLRATKIADLQGLNVFDEEPFLTAFERIFPEWDRKTEYRSAPLLRDFYVPVYESGYIDRLLLLPSVDTSMEARSKRNAAKRLRIGVATFPQLWLDE